MTEARDVVERYLAAYYSGDAQEARRYLADDLTFAGPGAASATADAYLRASAHAMGLMRGAETHRIFADGPDVGVFHDLRLDHPVGAIAVASWYHVEGDKIAAIRTVFDTAPFAAGARQPTGETAVDPVCGMAVATAGAVATRRHEGTTYYFCTPGCSAAFEEAPEKYLASSR
jgi:YHS domain-containing protein/limonene-1,2-epoxide hydrolase